MVGELGFHGLRVWPISTIRFRDLVYGFSSFEICHGSQIWLLFVLGLRVFHSKFLFFGFSNSYSRCRQLRSKNQFSNAYNEVQRVSGNGNVEKNLKLPMKIEVFVQKCTFEFLLILVQAYGL